MVNYPCLSVKQQQTLPELIQARALPVMYEDSTNHLWHCETVDGPMMLKVCDSQNVNTSSFWQGMELLFDVDLPNQLDKFELLYNDISTFSSLTIPDFRGSDSALEEQASPAFILARFLSGAMVESEQIDDQMVADLAEHISALHHNHRATFGAVYSEGINVSQWPNQLRDSLIVLADKQKGTIPNKFLNDALVESKTCIVEYFVPIMPDLRWDQFLQQNGELSALVDLDAVVYGPKELEFVLLELLLNEQQAIIFMDKYQQIHALPNLAKVRTSYRLLLFMMNVLGEKDVDAWMQAPTRF